MSKIGIALYGTANDDQKIRINVPLRDETVGRTSAAPFAHVYGEIAIGYFDNTAVRTVRRDSTFSINIDTNNFYARCTI